MARYEAGYPNGVWERADRCTPVLTNAQYLHATQLPTLLILQEVAFVRQATEGALWARSEVPATFGLCPVGRARRPTVSGRVPGNTQLLGAVVRPAGVTLKVGLCGDPAVQ